MSNVYRILAVDDDRISRRLVQRALNVPEFDVWTAASGEEALRLIKKRGLPHAAVIDLNMPRMDGFALCKRLHKVSDLPIIMLTSEDDKETLVKGLNQYVEDYVVKPLYGEELLARLRRLLRRIGDFSYALEPIITVDEKLKVNFAERLIYLNEERISLTPNETKLLYLLMHNAGRVVPTSYLLNRIWPLDEAYEDRLHPLVYRLRKKIEISPKSPKYIVSEWSKGYFFPHQVDEPEIA